MALICTVCHRTLQADAAEPEPKRFGLCEDCRISFMLKRKEPGLDACVDCFSEPVLVVDADARLLACNRSAEEAFGLKQTALMGLQPGEILGCDNAETDGCGRGPDCGTCALRQAILYTLRNDRDCERLPILLPVTRLGRSLMRCVSVSTRKIGPSVRVQLEDDGLLPAP